LRFQNGPIFGGNIVRERDHAYGFLRGIARSRIEPGARSEPDWERVQRMARKYAAAALDVAGELDRWKGVAK
jgi:hypothetical protein